MFFVLSANTYMFFEEVMFLLKIRSELAAQDRPQKLLIHLRVAHFCLMVIHKSTFRFFSHHLNRSS